VGLCDVQAADVLSVSCDHVTSSLVVQRESFKQQISDAEALINETADEICRSVDNDRRRLLLETNAIHRNTLDELDKVS